MQNEVNVASGSVPVYLRTIVPQLVKKDIVIPLWYWPVYGRDSQLVRNKALDDLGVQTFTDVYKEAFGKEPEGPKFQALMLVSDVGAQLNQGMFVAPGTPEAAVNELRQAYNALRNDSDFLHNFRRTILGRSDADPSISQSELAAIGPDFVTAEEGEAIFSRIRNMSSDVKDIVRHTVGAE